MLFRVRLLLVYTLTSDLLAATSYTTMNQPPHGDSLLTALVAGCSASGVTAFLTYPLDFLKTSNQLTNSKALAKYKINQHITSIAHVMTGSSALVVGSVLKNSARLVSYNWASNFMAIETHSDKKKTSAPRVVIAGAMSGFAETLWIVPFERIKTTMIENRLLVAEVAGNPNKAVDITGNSIDKYHKQNIFAKQYVSPHAYYTSQVLADLKAGKAPSKFQADYRHHHLVQPRHGKSALDALKMEFNKTPALTLIRTIRQMYALEGIHAFTAGTFITFARQVGTSAAWFSTYNATRQLIDPHGKSKEPKWFSLNIGTFQQAFLHMVSAGAAVVVTQPLDVIKSHMQLKNGRLLYRDSLSTAYKLVAKKGFTALFSGAFPRGVKIAVHGSLTAFLYSSFENGINVLGNKSVFTD